MQRPSPRLRSRRRVFILGLWFLVLLSSCCMGSAFSFQSLPQETTTPLRLLFRSLGRPPPPSKRSWTLGSSTSAIVVGTRHSVTMAAAQEDLFGDDVFLSDFDVDAAVAAAQQQNNENNNVIKKPLVQQAFRDPSSVPLQQQQQEEAPAMDAFPGLNLDTVITPATKVRIRDAPISVGGGSIAQPKRFKVTPSPLASSTALQASRRTMQDEPQQPFGGGLKISTGHVTDPLQELATNTPMQDVPHANDMLQPQQEDSVALIQHKTAAPLLTSALQQTLQKHFGFSQFRPGQLEVLHALLQDQRDAAVFWATGSGKSLCYQVPPLHTGHVGLVVSPLISLMQDQVNKLNGLSAGDEHHAKIATYLGSSQMDPQEEERALRGEYRLVYVTPEKLCSNGFLNRLAHMHLHTKRLCLIAIDESHCVSEWGHDFRPEYRSLGKVLRQNVHLDQVPLLALTATAVPRVQDDICTSLQLRPNVHVARQSFDRNNLQFQVFKKDKPGGYATALRPLVQEYQTKGASAFPSTIIYVPTIDQVMQIATFLHHEMANGQHPYDNNKKNTMVQPYHGKMDTATRSQAHLNFLVGRTKVIVATVAFGMGIDKPDTRRIIHWGPPKTVEEYYQQVGRAGRDGLAATCTMYVTESDFDRYKSDFYLGGTGLSPRVKQNMEASMDALRSYAFDTVTCRRKALLNFFHETSPFGERCGTCDTCRNQTKYGEDSQRDFGTSNGGARVVLTAIRALQGQAMGTIEKVISAKEVEPYRYQQGYSRSQVSMEIQALKRAMEKKKPLSYFRELMTPLVSLGYIKQATSKTTIDGFSRTWGVYDLTPKGRNALIDKTVPIVLPVPPSLREVERDEEEKRQRFLEQLEHFGIDLTRVPKEELEAGDGEVIRSFKKWNVHLESLRSTQREDRIAKLQDLVGRIEQWRSDTAAEFSMAPASVLAEHQVASIAYTAATMKPGGKVEERCLVMAGIRARGVSSLVASLGEWVDEVQPSSEAANDGEKMVFPAEPFAPTGAWEYAVYKPLKKTGVASWESSHSRFLRGDHPQTIAMSPENGRPIQVATVVGHILDGLTHGRPVPLQRLAEALPPPTKKEWDEMERLEVETGMDVTGDPETSGADCGKFTMTEFLRPIMGDNFVETPYKARSEEDKIKFSKWCEVLKWYMALRRAKYGKPQFQSGQDIV